MSMVSFVLRAVALAALVALSCMPAAARTVPADQVREAISRDNAIFVDIREAEEWKETGVPEGARLLSMSDFDFEEMLETLTGGDKSRRIILMCRTGQRSAELAKRLTARGFTHVDDVAGGLIGRDKEKGWIGYGLPVVAFTGQV